MAMSKLDPVLARKFAVDVVRRLREAGFIAFWAGGCVRDFLLGLTPKDYDVATSATPEQIRDIFGRRRTLAIGQAFGVITVLGPKHAGPIEIATFRADSQYSDGRHPDSVTFSDAQNDALRRDFTINGLFFDPIDEQVIDYVGGQADLQRRTIRAIGDPLARISEDKLRMLRAVRIATTFDFEIDPATFAAIRQQAHEIVIVSAERIAAELRRCLTHDSRVRAAELLKATGLLEVIMPDLSQALVEDQWQPEPKLWPTTLAMLRQLDSPCFAVALALLLRGCSHEETERLAATRQTCAHLRLTNHEISAVEFFFQQECVIRAARDVPWPRLQRVLIHPRAGELLQYCRAVAIVLDESTDQIDYCQSKLDLPPEELNPPPLLTGNDLKSAGLKPGPIFSKILHQVRDQQLESRIETNAEAMSLALALYAEQQRGRLD